MRTWVVRLVAVLAMISGRAGADPIAVPLDARTGLNVTVYGDGLAFVRDQRDVDLPGGISALDIVGVSRELIAGSAWLESGEEVRVLSLAGPTDVLTPEGLLRRALGSEVLIVRAHPQTGEERAETAILHSIDGGVIVGYEGRIEATPPGRLAFRKLPSGLRVEAALMAVVEAKAAGRGTLTLSYLTNGLNWLADYVIVLDEAMQRATLAARASVSNGTGIALKNAHLGLIAGRINRVSAPVAQPRVARAEMMVAAGTESAPPERQAVADLHLYRLTQPVTIDDRQTRQFRLFEIDDQPIARSYVSEGGSSLQALRGGEVQPTHPNVHVALTVPGGADAQPFPEGIARLFVLDATGALRLLGEDRVPPTPAGGRLTLELGEAFDIALRRRQTDFIASREPSTFTESAWQILIDNSKGEAVEVRVIERLPGDWKILSSTTPYVKEAADRVSWKLPVPAKGRVELNYRVRIQR